MVWNVQTNSNKFDATLLTFQDQYIKKTSYALTGTNILYKSNDKLLILTTNSGDSIGREFRQETYNIQNNKTTLISHTKTEIEYLK
jgi:hypothetical protein